jgi:hypothetical protein
MRLRCCPRESRREIPSESSTSGYSAQTIVWITKAAAGASFFQYMVPRIFGMTSEQTRIKKVRTPEKTATHSFPRSSSPARRPVRAHGVGDGVEGQNRGDRMVGPALELAQQSAAGKALFEQYLDVTRA